MYVWDEGRGSEYGYYKTIIHLNEREGEFPGDDARWVVIQRRDTGLWYSSPTWVPLDGADRGGFTTAEEAKRLAETLMAMQLTKETLTCQQAQQQ